MSDAGACVLIGNGPSRSECNLEVLRGRVPVYGCNALHRDAPWVDRLIVKDARLLQEAREAGYPEDRLVPDQPKLRHLNSGDTLAVWAAAVKHHSPVYLVGYDFTFGNVYAGTPHYGDRLPRQSAALTDWNRFRRWEGEVVARCPETRWVRVGNYPALPPHSGDRTAEIRWDDFAVRIGAGEPPLTLRHIREVVAYLGSEEVPDLCGCAEALSEVDELYRGRADHYEGADPVHFAKLHARRIFKPAEDLNVEEVVARLDRILEAMR